MNAPFALDDRITVVLFAGMGGGCDGLHTIIDWSLPVRSIFGRKKDLAEATLRRTARGVMRYVVDAAKPFIVPITHSGGDRVHNSDEPLRTLTTAHRGELAVVARPALAEAAE